MAATRSIVSPAKITFVMDNRVFQEEIAALSPIRRRHFLAACNVSSPENLTWRSECPGRVSYNWQAEFRSWHIRKHDALKNYKWMMWVDTDGFVTRPWKQDPIATMIEFSSADGSDGFICSKRDVTILVQSGAIGSRSVRNNAAVARK